MTNISSVFRKYYWKLYAIYKLGDSQHSVFGAFDIGYKKNVKIGTNLQINKGVYIQGREGVVIGNRVTLSMGVKILDSGLDTRSIIDGEKNNIHIDKAITIGNDVWIGTNAIILAGVTIGNNSVVGAGSIVTKSIPSNTIVAGNPAKALKCK